MELPRWILALSMLLAAGVIACTSTSAPPTAPKSGTAATDVAVSPAATVAPLDATRAAIAAAPVLKAPGWLVYLRGNDLYAGNLLTGIELPLTTGSLGAGYAGHAEIDGNTWIYYTSIVGETPQAGVTEGAFAVFRRLLGPDNTNEERLFEFSASDRYVIDSSANASVSPDGNYVVYADDSGLHLYDLGSHAEHLLLSNEPASPRDAPAGVNTRGVRYSHPAWSPTGGWLLVSRGENRWPYNGSATETIRPGEAITEYTLGGRGAWSWSPDGEHLCGNTSATASSGFGLLTPGSDEAVDLTLSLFDNAILRPSVGSCAWADDGRLAVSYEASGLDHFTIAVLDSAGSVVMRRIDAGAVVPGIASWLPDRTGFVIATLSSTMSFSSAAILMDGSYRRLPFDAGRVLGAVSVPYQDD